MAKKSSGKAASKVQAPEAYKPPIYLEGKHATAIQKAGAVGKTVKVMVHAKVTNHGIDEFSGAPTARLQVKKVEPVSGTKKPPIGNPMKPAAKDQDAGVKKGMTPAQKTRFDRADAKADKKIATSVKKGGK